MNLLQCNPVALSFRSQHNIGTFKKVRKGEKGMTVALKAGVPFVLFSLLATWVVSNAVDGKLKEMDINIRIVILKKSEG